MCAIVSQMRSRSLLTSDPLASNKASSSSNARVPNSIGTPLANIRRWRNNTRKRPNSSDASAAERLAPSSLESGELVTSKFSILFNFRTSLPFAVWYECPQHHVLLDIGIVVTRRRWLWPCCDRSEDHLGHHGANLRTPPGPAVNTGRTSPSWTRVTET